VGPGTNADPVTNDEVVAEGSSASNSFGRNSFQNKKRKEISLRLYNRSVMAMSTNSLYEYAEGKDYDARLRAEIETRADTLCDGATFRRIGETGMFADVTGFHDHLMTKNNVPICTAATAYDCLRLNRTLILVANQALFFGTSMKHSLVPPNQL
jgi:hypothetical protein